MRLFARRCGFSLSDHGICEATHARARGRGPRLWTGPPIAQHRFQTEKESVRATGTSRFLRFVRSTLKVLEQVSI